MTIETLITELGFEFKEDKLREYENKIKETIKSINRIDKPKLEVDTKQSIKQTQELKQGLIDLAKYAGKASRAFLSMGKLSFSALKSASNIATNLTKTLTATVAGAVTASAVIADKVSETAKKAESFGTDYATVKALLTDTADITADNILDLFEEMRNKIQLTKTSLERDLKLGTIKKEEFNLTGYIDEKGKKREAKKLEESTLDDLISTGVFAKVDKEFSKLTNKIDIFNKFQKMTANEQFMLMAKIVDYNKNYISSMDDWLSGESQKLFSQLKANADKAGISITQLIERNKKLQLFDNKDIQKINNYKNSLNAIGRILNNLSIYATSIFGENATVYLDKLNKYIRANATEIKSFIKNTIDYSFKVSKELFNYLRNSNFLKEAKQKVKDFFLFLKNVNISDTINYLKDLFEKIKIFATFLIGLGAIFVAVFAPIPTLIAGIIIGLSALLTAFVTNFSSIKAEAIRVFNAIKNFVLDTFNSIKSFALDIVNSIISFFSNLYNQTINIFGEVKNYISSTLISVKDFFFNTFNAIYSYISNVIDSLINKIKSILNVASIIKNKISSTISNASKSIKSFFGIENQATVKQNSNANQAQQKTANNADISDKTPRAIGESQRLILTNPTNKISNLTTTNQINNTNINNNVTNQVNITVTKPNATANEIATEVNKALTAKTIIKNTPKVKKAL